MSRCDARATAMLLVKNIHSHQPEVTSSAVAAAVVAAAGAFVHDLHTSDNKSLFSIKFTALSHKHTRTCLVYLSSSALPPICIYLYYI